PAARLPQHPGLRGVFVFALVNRAQFDDLEGAATLRSGHLDLVANPTVEQGATERRADRNQSGRWVDLLWKHDFVTLLGPVVAVFQRYLATVPHRVAGDRVDGVKGQVADALLDLRDTGAHKPLPLLTRFILGILAQIAVCARDLQLLG